MTVGELKDALALTVLVEGDLRRPVTGGYCGDLLSWVMGRAGDGDAWISVMGNVNAVAVCVLAGTACLILAEDAALDDAARSRAEMEGVPVLRSDRSAFELAAALSRLLAS